MVIHVYVQFSPSNKFLGSTLVDLILLLLLLLFSRRRKEGLILLFFFFLAEVSNWWIPIPARSTQPSRRSRLHNHKSQPGPSNTWRPNPMLPEAAQPEAPLVATHLPGSALDRGHLATHLPVLSPPIRSASRRTPPPPSQDLLRPTSSTVQRGMADEELTLGRRGVAGVEELSLARRGVDGVEDDLSLRGRGVAGVEDDLSLRGRGVAGVEDDLSLRGRGVARVEDDLSLRGRGVAGVEETDEHLKVPVFDIIHKYDVLEKKQAAPTTPPVIIAHPSPKRDIVPVLTSLDEGWTDVKSRKFGMRRGAHRHEVAPDPPVHVCVNEIPWSAIYGGCRRKIRHWYQARRTGMGMNARGPGYIAYGSYGPYGHEF